MRIQISQLFLQECLLLVKAFAFRIFIDLIALDPGQFCRRLDRSFQGVESVYQANFDGPLAGPYPALANFVDFGHCLSSSIG